MSLPLLAGPFHAVAGLLVLAGVAKVVRPEPAGAALRSAGIAVGGAGARLLGVIEALVGVGAIATGGRVAALAIAALYAGFAAFVVAALVRRETAPCGCFGAGDVPPGWVHLAVDVAAVGVAVAVAVRPVGPLAKSLDAGALDAATFVMYVGLAVYLLFVALTALPRLAGARQ